MKKAKLDKLATQRINRAISKIEKGGSDAALPKWAQRRVSDGR